MLYSYCDENNLAYIDSISTQIQGLFIVKANGALKARSILFTHELKGAM